MIWVAVGVLVFIIVRVIRVWHLPNGPWQNYIPVVGYLPFMGGGSPHKQMCKLGTGVQAHTVVFGSYPIVVLNDMELTRTCFKNPDFCGRPNHLLAMSLSSKGLTFATGPEAFEIRRFVLKTLRDFGFGKPDMEELILNQVNYLAEEIAGKHVVFEHLFGLSVINALWSVLASRTFGIADQYAQHVYHVCIRGFIDPPVSGTLWFMPWVARLFPNYSGYNATVQAVSELKNLVKKVVDEHVEEFNRTNEIHDFVDAYVQKIQQTTDPESCFYRDTGYDNLVHVLVDLFTAGSDTLNSSLNFALKYLHENESVLRTLESELEQHVGHGNTVTLAHRPSLVYLEAVIYEIFRHSSIVTNGILHCTLADTVLHANNTDYRIPAGTIVMPNLYGMHRDGAVWDRPEEFDPGRFVEKPCLKHYVTAFSTGKRVCIAENLAFTEFFLFLGNLVNSFTFNVTDFGTVKAGLVLNVTGLQAFVTRKT